MVYISARDEEVIGQVVRDQHVTSVAAAYTVYVELTPGNKKPMSQRDFYQRFRDNWDAFLKIEAEAQDEF